MKCPRCSEEISQEVAFCPRCGTPVSGIESPVQRPRPGPKLAYAAAAVLLVVILCALVIKAAFSGKSATQADQPPPPPGPLVTNAPPPGLTGGPSVTNAPPAAPPVANPSPAPSRPAPPQDVLDYLQFVKQVEERRQLLLRDTSRLLALAAGSQAKSLLDMIDWAMEGKSGSQYPQQVAEVKKELGLHVQNWQGLVRLFDSRSAPYACAEFAGSYRAALTTELAGIYRIVTILNGTDWTNIDSLSRTYAELQRMKSDSDTQGNIDKSVELADGKLGELSARIGIAKPFEVKKESEVSGSIIGGL